MSSHPCVSIIVNCRNAEKYLNESLSSIYSQSYDDWEIILFDNASTDLTAEIAKGWGEKLRYFYCEEPLGLGAARNKALLQCRGSYIAFLDSDDKWLPNKLELQIGLFESSDVGLVYTNCLSFTNHGAVSLMFKVGQTPPVGSCFGDLLERYQLVLSSVMVRKKCLQEVGMYFDDHLNVAEEAELFLRVAYRYSLACCSDVLTLYRAHAESESWKKSILFFDEAQYIVNKFVDIYPNFYKDYWAQAEKYLNSAMFGCAVAMWRAGENLKARREMRLLRPQTIKIRITALLTFIPFEILRPAIALITRRLYPKIERH